MHRKILNKPFRLNPSTVLFLLLLAVSIICMPSCSSDSDNAALQPNYIVQATVSVEEDGPVAYALVMDGDKNLIDTLNLSINGDPMTIEYDVVANGETTEVEVEDGSPIYTMDLSDLKGGDMVVFEARDQFGAIIYAPEPAVIPMAIELLEPEEGQEIVAGDEIIIRWAGGEGAEVFSAAYVALDGSALYSEELDSEGLRTFTIPPSKIAPGAAVFGVGAITGETEVVDTFDSGFITSESYFLVSREAGAVVDVISAGESTVEETESRALTKCPYAGGSYDDSHTSCVAQFAALGIGAIVWTVRRNMDAAIEGMAPCRSDAILNYCASYGCTHGFACWRTGGMACVTSSTWRCRRWVTYWNGVTLCRNNEYYCDTGANPQNIFAHPRGVYCRHKCQNKLNEYHNCD